MTEPHTMHWASASSDHPVFESAFEECMKKIRRELKTEPDLAVGFISQEHAASYSDFSKAVYKELRPGTFLGCSAGGVIGGGREIEQKTGLSLTAAILPGVAIYPFHIENDFLPDMDARPKTWHDLVGVTPDQFPQFVLLADPFSIDVERFVQGMDYAFLRSTKVGGMASAGRKPRENALYLNREIHKEGLVGVALSGNIVLDSVVAQGCKPIGKPMLVTRSDGNVLFELDEEPPLKVLEDLYSELDPADQDLLRTSLFIGVAMDATHPTHAQGDFLIRNIVGADPERGIIAVSAELRQGQTVQFHLRDARTSAEDLDLLLSQYATKPDKKNAKGGLLFSCLGRGVYLYGKPDHDTQMFQKKVGDLPLGGFFCNREVGPVKSATYLHGYTSCFGIFRPAR